MVSCDTHKENTFIYAVDTRTGEIKMERNVFGGIKEAMRAIGGIGKKKEMVVLYEAGILGYSLYRHLTGTGYHCKIIAPTSIPRLSKVRKTDHDDAIGNFNYYCSGLLRFVWVPTIMTESSRECLRYRYQMVWNVTAEKQKVQAMLKRQGLIFTETKKPWTKKHFAWLKTVEMPAEMRVVLDMRIEKLHQLGADVKKLDEQLQSIMMSNAEYCRLYEAYLKLTGIGPLAAVTWVLEGQDLNRFAHPGHLMSYIGVVPKKCSSGGKDPAMHITKAGNSYMRYVTVCAAKWYTDRRAVQRKEKLEKYPDAIRDVVSRCQDRLCSRYQELRNNKKNGNKAKVAIARELCGFIWELATKALPLSEAQEREMKKAA